MDASLNFEGGIHFVFFLDPFVAVVIDVFGDRLPGLEVVRRPGEGGRLDQSRKGPPFMDGQQFADHFSFFALAFAASLFETKASSF